MEVGKYEDVVTRYQIVVVHVCIFSRMFKDHILFSELNLLAYFN